MNLVKTLKYSSLQWLKVPQPILVEKLKVLMLIEYFVLAVSLIYARCEILLGLFS